MLRSSSERHGDTVAIRCTPAVREALERIALRNAISGSAYARAALIARLKADGELTEHP
jgi:hypothetical protein